MSEENKNITKISNFKFELPSSMQETFAKIGGMVSFALKFFKEVFFPPYEVKEILKQLYEIGYKSLGLVGITGFIIGLTLTLQSIPAMSRFGAESLVPSMVALGLVLEIGPVISALIFSGKIGSGIGAEIGSMKVSEQIDAMEVSGTNPYKYLVVSRIISTTLMLPLLVIYSDLIGLLGGYLALNISGSMSLKLFMISSFSSISFRDIIPAVIKTFVFGFAIGTVGCYEGYNASRGTESVGIAANTAVVISSLLVILIDMIAVQVTTILF